MPAPIIRSLGMPLATVAIRAALIFGNVTPGFMGHDRHSITRP